MVPVGTPREGLAVGERLLDGLGVWHIAPEYVLLVRRRVREVLELDELRGLGDAGLGNREEVAAPLGRIVFRLEGVVVRKVVEATRSERRAEEKKFSFILSNACAGMRALT